MTVTLIAAHAARRVIGLGGGIPWHSSEDFGHFKAATLGHTLVMGRLTHESIGRPLPGRRTIVVTRNREWSDVGVEVAYSLEEALALAAGGDRGAEGTADPEIYVAGGAQIYAAALPFATRQVLTEIDIEVPGDTFYPEFSTDEWHEVRRIARPELDPPLAWVWWERRTAETAPHSTP